MKKKIKIEKILKEYILVQLFLFSLSFFCNIDGMEAIIWERTYVAHYHNNNKKNPYLSLSDKTCPPIFVYLPHNKHPWFEHDKTNETITVFILPLKPFFSDTIKKEDIYNSIKNIGTCILDWSTLQALCHHSLFSVIKSRCQLEQLSTDEQSQDAFIEGTAFLISFLNGYQINMNKQKSNSPEQNIFYTFKNILIPDNTPLSEPSQHYQKETPQHNFLKNKNDMYKTKIKEITFLLSQTSTELVSVKKQLTTVNTALQNEQTIINTLINTIAFEQGCRIIIGGGLFLLLLYNKQKIAAFFVLLLIPTFSIYNPHIPKTYFHNL